LAMLVLLDCLAVREHARLAAYDQVARRSTADYWVVPVPAPVAGSVTSPVSPPYSVPRPVPSSAGGGVVVVPPGLDGMVADSSGTLYSSVTPGAGSTGRSVSRSSSPQAVSSTATKGIAR